MLTLGTLILVGCFLIHAAATIAAMNRSHIPEKLAKQPATRADDPFVAHIETTNAPR